MIWVKKAAGLLLVVLLIALVVLGWHWLLFATGTSGRGTSYPYGFWSGFASDLPEFAILAMLWRKINCHAAGCHRIGLHHVDGTPYITCRKHHPKHPGSDAPTPTQIAQAHLEAQDR